MLGADESVFSSVLKESEHSDCFVQPASPRDDGWWRRYVEPAPRAVSSACADEHLENCRASTSILSCEVRLARTNNFVLSKLRRANGGCLGAKNR